MEIKKIQATIEAILFTMGEAVDLDSLAKCIEHDKETTRRIIHNMMDNYSGEDRGIQIVELDNSFQMCTKPEMYEAIIKIINTPKKHILTDALLETLSIIAYKQPVTKAEIEAIRGVSSDHSVNKLVEYNLVCELGRMDAPGRPILFGTTREFLRNFGLESLDELPSIKPDKLKSFKQEVNEEVAGDYPEEFDDELEDIENIEDVNNIDDLNTETYEPDSI
ncbi:MAG: SMC-Scp complex subunit ScpB [Clostridiales bacterium]|nr:SMC-Scp complex subunit ScpB [Clostridiales bacterium]